MQEELSIYRYLTLFPHYVYFSGLLIYFGYGIWNSSIETRFHDTTRKDGKDGKEAILMDTNDVNVSIEAKFFESHTRTQLCILVLYLIYFEGSLLTFFITLTQ